MNTQIKETSTLLERLKKLSKGLSLENHSKRLDVLVFTNQLFGGFFQDLSELLNFKKNFDEDYMAKNLLIIRCLFSLRHNSLEYNPSMNSDPYFTPHIMGEFLETIIDKSIWERYESELSSRNYDVFCEQLANMITSEHPHINVEIDDNGMKLTHVNERQKAA